MAVTEPAEPEEPDDDRSRAVLAQTALFMDSWPRAVVVWGLHGTVLAWNRNAERLYGWDAEAVLGQHIGDLLIRAADLDDAYVIAEGVEAGTTWSGDITIRRVGGEPVRIHTVLSPLRDADGTIVGSIGIADDVTDQRIVEERAAELTNHLLLALAGGELGTWRWDRSTGDTRWDANMERLFGLEPGAFDGRFETWVSMVHPDDRDHMLDVLDRAIADVDSFQVEHRVVWSDGSIHWLQGRAMVTLGVDGEVSGTIGCFGDVTARKAAEQEIVDRAVEAERLLAHGELQRRRLEFLARINETAMLAANHRELMGDVTRAAVPELGDWCSIHFFDGTLSAHAIPEIVVAHQDPTRLERLHELLVQHPYDPSAPIGAAAAIRGEATQFIEDFGPIRDAVVAGAVRATPDEARAVLDELDPVSLIAVPLTTKRGVIGAIQFVSAESGRHYGPDDVSLAETAAGRVADALESAWLREQQRNVATVLQAALLPDVLPDIDGLDIAARYWAAGGVSDVGGDFYDVFRIGPEPSARWAFVIGDVCGTGPEAATLTAMARHTLRAAAHHGATPVEALEWLNEAILERHGDRFCTVLYCEMDALEGGRWRLTTVTAGHPLALRVPGGGKASTVGRSGTLLGVLPELRLHTDSVELDVGDTVLLHTDGITDVPDPFGIDEASLARMVTESATAAGAEAVAERLRAAVDDVLPLDEREDDIALVVIRVGDHAAVDEPDAVFEASFACDPAEIATAREFAVASVPDASLGDALRLAVSELATNAVIHARTPFTVRVVRHGGGGTVRVSVTDHSTDLPVRQERRPDAAGGRGIAIVEHLASEWGVESSDGGKTVWFEVTARGV